MKYIVILLCLCMTGCGGYVTPDEFKKYEELCASNGGIKSVWKLWLTTLYCVNGAVFNENALTVEVHKK